MRPVLLLPRYSAAISPNARNARRARLSVTTRESREATSARTLALASGGHRASTRNKDAARRRGGHRRPCKYPPRIGRASLNHEEVTARARGSPSHRPASTFPDQPGFRRTLRFVTSPNQVARDQRFCVRPVASTSRRPAGAAALQDVASAQLVGVGVTALDEIRSSRWNRRL